ncbi:MAG: glycerol-3-phosphate dehydrogenase [Cyanobacteriota bacterium]
MRDFPAIENSTYDLIVIGGGINGAGVARDAALRGLTVILLEKEDFGSGTTSGSTRLIHGGLRYLESFEFSLVRESLQEREILLRIAPHLVHPLQLTIPIYNYNSRPYWQIQAGMILYDILSFNKTLPSHRMLPNRKFQQVFRHINSQGLQGGAQYFDCQVENAERLCWENVLAAQTAGATVLNYVTVTQLHQQEHRITHLTCKDNLTGEVFTVRGSKAAIVVNTSGPWVDKICDRTVTDTHPSPISTKPKIGGTKGSHIMVDPFPGAPKTALYVEAKADNRPFFIVPWLGLYLIGTTDIRYNGNLDRVKADNEEIDYLLAETNRIIPTANLSRSDVKFTYSGVRPLPYSDESKKAGSITRRHILYDHTKEGVENLISLIGGKLTTYRQVGEEIVNAVYRKLGRSAPPCPTKDQPLPGAILPSDPRIVQAVEDYPQINSTTIHHLFQLYGARAPEVLALTKAHSELQEAIAPNLPDIKAQIVYAIQVECAHTLEDIALRRTTLAMHTNYGLDILPVLTETLIRYCGWNSVQCDSQIQHYRDYIQAKCMPDYLYTTTAPELQVVRDR